MKRLVLVSAALLVNSEKKILLTQRPAGKSMAGFWEFPGGKVEPGEVPEQTLIRELYEELGITTIKNSLIPFIFASHSYLEFHLLMPIFICQQWQGNIFAKEKQNFNWVFPDEMKNYNLLPADQPLIPLICKFFAK